MCSLVKFIITVFLLIISQVSHGQSIHSISGRIINHQNDLLPGNALIISSKDSTITKGTSFFEGTFKLSNLKQEQLLLKLTSMGYKDTLINISYKGIPDIDLGTINMEVSSDQLEEVILISNTPLYKTKTDGTIKVNVENTVLATSNSVEEILSRSPGLIVDDEGISVIGKGVAIIYVNGQRILNEQLANIQASEIKNIEIISSPSAKYDAEGQAVINISTIKTATEGVKGILSQNISTSDFAPPEANTVFSLDYRKQNLSLMGNYGLQLGTNRFILNTTRNRSAEGDLFNSDITTDWERKRTYFANYGTGIQYYFGKDSYVSMAYNGVTNDLGGTESSNNTINTNQESEQFASIVHKNDLTTQHAFILNYLQTIDTLGSSLYVGGQYSLYNTKTDDFINETSIINDQTFNRSLKNIVDQDIPIHSIQLDYTKVFAKQNQLETGIKYGQVNNTSASQFLISEDTDGFIINENLSRDFEYNEKIYAAYISYKKNIADKINYNLGVRSEYTSYTLNTGYTNQNLIENDYFNIFPNFSMGIPLKENYSLFTSYSSRIARPRYQSLNPSIIYQDAFTSIQGNPNIVPEKIHALEIGVNLKKLTIKLGYNHTIDPITGGAVQGEDPKSYILQRLNSDREHDYYSSIHIPFKTNWWTSMNTITASYKKLIDTQSSFGFKETKPQAYVYTNNKFTIYKDLKLQLIAWYLSNRYDGIYFRKNQGEITIGLEKNLLHKTLKLQVIANDIFHTNKPDGNYQLGETSILFDRIYNTQYFRFVATYNFGKLKKTNYQHKSSGAEEQDRL
ncbi:outer membrane beta-barrel family protein [Aquimarina addita]|uniref:Outer membrane beta-barrel family protein n=1 Tax=Aquimarina addita TaxID=870485 RepID=A0ABP7XFQ7_9FLAO